MIFRLLTTLVFVIILIYYLELVLCFIMSEEGEFSDVSKPVNASKEGENDSSSSSSSEHCIARRKSKSKKRDKYSSLKSRFKRLESLVTKALCPETNSAKPSCVETNSKRDKL